MSASQTSEPQATYIPENDAAFFVHFWLVVVIDAESRKQDLILVRGIGSLIFLESVAFGSWTTAPMLTFNVFSASVASSPPN